jgi:predicted hotdog family 3-hydroxylacyl-ACP dehydratase
MQVLKKTELAKLLPHEGAMCLLETVEGWDAESITCRAISHRDPDHPLRVNECLPAICGAEYAAQAMAVHGALTSPQSQRAGMLAALREVKLLAPRLDDLKDDLMIHARKLFALEHRFLYEFSVRCGAKLVLSGRGAVFLDSNS